MSESEKSGAMQMLELNLFYLQKMRSIIENTEPIQDGSVSCKELENSFDEMFEQIIVSCYGFKLDLNLDAKENRKNFTIYMMKKFIGLLPIIEKGFG